jgi:hypothetical protein
MLPNLPDGAGQYRNIVLRKHKLALLDYSNRPTLMLLPYLNKDRRLGTICKLQKVGKIGS